MPKENSKLMQIIPCAASGLSAYYAQNGFEEYSKTPVISWGLLTSGEIVGISLEWLPLEYEDSHTQICEDSPFFLGYYDESSVEGNAEDFSIRIHSRLSDIKYDFFWVICERLQNKLLGKPHTPGEIYECFHLFKRLEDDSSDWINDFDLINTDFGIRANMPKTDSHTSSGQTAGSEL